MAISAIVGPGLLIGSFTLFIIIGFAVSILENRLNAKREH